MFQRVKFVCRLFVEKETEGPPWIFKKFDFLTCSDRSFESITFESKHHLLRNENTAPVRVRKLVNILLRLPAVQPFHLARFSFPSVHCV